MSQGWLDALKKAVEEKPLVVFQLQSDEWSDLRESRHGGSEFSIVRPHNTFEGIRVPTACILLAQHDSEPEVRLGIVSSLTPVATLQSRVKVRRARNIQPTSKDGLLSLVSRQPYKSMLRTKMSSKGSVVRLSQKLSSHLIGLLSQIESNQYSLRAVNSSLSDRKLFVGMASLQEDAVYTALSAFGLSKHEKARDLAIIERNENAFHKFDVVEDGVIEHDARSIRGYQLVHSGVTGCATFERGPEKLEVYTANRRPLEKVFGVDLIYLNLTRGNIVMVQYKMLERTKSSTKSIDWIYRPDEKIESQIRRMEKFCTEHPLTPNEYRLNPQIFYLKFVKRNSRIGSPAITIPLDHYKRLSSDPEFRGPNGGFRIGFESFGGRYLRQTAFIDLIRSGYIGSSSTTTRHLVALMERALAGDRAVVAAIQSSVREEPPTE